MVNRKVGASDINRNCTIRASVSFPESQYLVLEKIAIQKKVSVAWVVREAVENYLTAQWPLLENSFENSNLSEDK